MQDPTRTTDEIARIAWLYHVGGMSQEEVSRMLGLSRFKVMRLLAEARERGIVRVVVEHETAETLALAEKVRRAYGLAETLVAPGAGAMPGEAAAYARRAVGIAAASLLARRLEGNAPVTVGIGWGRTIAQMASAATGSRRGGVRFVTLMGTLSRMTATSPSDVCAQLADLCGGEAHLLPTPFIMDSEAACRSLVEQRLVRETLEIARASDVAFVSLGECTADALLFRAGILDETDLRALRAAGAVADTTGKFFDAQGRLLDHEINRRTPSISLEDLDRLDVVLLAAGRGKAQATRALLRSGLVDRLVADADLASALLDDRG